MDATDSYEVVQEYSQCAQNKEAYGCNTGGRPLPISSRVERSHGSVMQSGGITRNIVCAHTKPEWCASGRVHPQQVQREVLNAQGGTFRSYETALSRKMEQHQQRSLATCGRLVQLAGSGCS